MSLATPLRPEHLPALERLMASLPDEDVVFMHEDVRSPSVLRELVEPGGRALRWVVLDGDDATAYAGLVPMVGLSDHVGELRLVVSPAHRRRGVGRRLAQEAMVAALGAGLRKVVVEVVADQDGTAAMFRGLGFEGEALLRDQVRDRAGELRDVLLLAHFADDTSSALSTIGVEG